MSKTMIEIDNVKKQYRLGTIGGGTLRGDLQSLWARMRHKDDPNSTIGEKAYKKNEKFMALDGVSFSVKKGETKIYNVGGYWYYEGENNIFPASFIVTLTDLEKTKDVITEVERIGAKIATEGRSKEVDLEIDETTIHDSLVKEIRNDDDVVSTLLAIANGIKVAIGVFFAGLLVVSVAIISNTIRLTVHARRKEISIMKYVGATNSFIRGPFIVEGIIIGLIAAIISIVIVGVVYDVVIVKVEASHILQQMSVTLTKFMEIAKPVSLIYCVLGMGVGIVGSMLSMNKYLEV